MKVFVSHGQMHSFAVFVSKVTVYPQETFRTELAVEDRLSVIIVFLRCFRVNINLFSAFISTFRCLGICIESLMFQHKKKFI